MNQEWLDDIISVILVVFSERFHTKFEDLNFEDSVVNVSKNDLYTFSHALMDVHEQLELQMDYEPLSEFETFQTMEDVVKYFYEQKGE